VATGNVREKTTSWWLPVGAGLSVLALVVVLAKGTLGGTDEPAEPEAAVTPPVPAHASVGTEPSDEPTGIEPAPASKQVASPVLITVRTIPPNASIRIDDGSPVEAPYSVELTPSTALRRIEASAPDYQNVTRQVVFDQTREIVLELQPRERSANGSRKPRSRWKAEPTNGSGTTAPAVIEVPVSREPGTLPTGPGKRPRALDDDNPFAG